jgi:ferrochelatase
MTRSPILALLLLLLAAVDQIPLLFGVTAFNLSSPPKSNSIRSHNDVAFPVNGRQRSRINAATTFDYLPANDAPPPSSSSLSSIKEPKVGVLLLNLGGPETSADVEGFLYNLFADPDIIRLPSFLSPLQSLVALIISKRRAPKSREAYNSIGGGSPILQYTQMQADLMTKALSSRHGISAKTYIGMRYWYPFTEEALSQIRHDGINALVILPLYPQFSISTSGSSLRVLQEEFAKHTEFYGPHRMFHTVIPSWYDRPGYIRSIANLIKKELDSFTPEEIREGESSGNSKIARHVLFSAHGVPASYIEAGDPYKAQIEDCVAKITKLLPTEEEGVKVHLSFQSRVGPVEWLRPYTDDVLPELGEMGVKNLVVVPISFVSEHIETLEEIDIEYRELALESGITNWRRSPALNTDAAFIDDMADMVADALNEPSQSITEACVANNVGNLDLESVSNHEEISSAGILGVGADDDLRGKMRLRNGELFNGRIAMIGIVATCLIELLSGKPLIHLFLW